MGQPRIHVFVKQIILLMLRAIYVILVITLVLYVQELRKKTA